MRGVPKARKIGATRRPGEVNARALDRESRAADIPPVDSESFRDPEASERVMRGARCVLCSDAVRLGEDAFVTPDFIADEQDPMWRYSDAVVHRACFYVWDRRKVFVARFNRLAQGLVASDGTRPFLTAEGHLVRRPAGPAGGTPRSHA